MSLWDMPTGQSKQTLYLPYLNKITVQNNNKLFTTITEHTIDQSTFTFKCWMRDMTTNLAVISEFDNLTFLSLAGYFYFTVELSFCFGLRSWWSDRSSNRVTSGKWEVLGTLELGIIIILLSSFSFRLKLYFCLF